MHRTFLLLASLLIVSSCDSNEASPLSFDEQQEIATEIVQSYHELNQTLPSHEAREALVNQLIEGGEVQDVRVESDGVSVCWSFEGGISACLVTETRLSGLSGTGTAQNTSAQPAEKTSTTHELSSSVGGTSRRALVLSPYKWQVARYGILIPLVNASAYTNDLFTNAGFNTEYLVNEDISDQNLSIHDFERLDDFDIIHMVTHGGIIKGDIFIGTGITVTDELDQQYGEELHRGTIAWAYFYEKTFFGEVSGRYSYILSATWFAERYPSALSSVCIIADVCHSTQNPTLSDALIGPDALTGSVFFGWDEEISTVHATRTSKDLATQLVANALPAGDAYERIEANGHAEGCAFPYILCPSSINPTVHFEIVGNATFRAVDSPIRIAATPPYWDDIGALLEDFGHNVTDIDFDDLDDLGVLSQFDIIAINCSPEIETPTGAEIIALRNFVEAGGKLYVSDYAFPYINATFPDAIDFAENPYGGSIQSILADVTHQDLASYLGTSTVEINFDLGAWVLVNGPGLGTNVLLQANVFESISSSAHPLLERSHLGTASNRTSSSLRPLALSFTYGDGEVVFTSFHNEEQLGDEVRFVLEYFTVL